MLKLSMCLSVFLNWILRLSPGQMSSFYVDSTPRVIRGQNPGNTKSMVCVKYKMLQNT